MDNSETCQACNSLLSTTALLSSCGHLFCETCKFCPVDNVNLVHTERVFFPRKEIKSLKIFEICLDLIGALKQREEEEAIRAAPVGEVCIPSHNRLDSLETRLLKICFLVDQRRSFGLPYTLNLDEELKQLIYTKTIDGKEYTSVNPFVLKFGFMGIPHAHGRLVVDFQTLPRDSFYDDIYFDIDNGFCESDPGDPGDETSKSYTCICYDPKSVKGKIVFLGIEVRDFNIPYPPSEIVFEETLAKSFEPFDKVSVDGNFCLSIRDNIGTLSAPDIKLVFNLDSYSKVIGINLDATKKIMIFYHDKSITTITFEGQVERIKNGDQLYFKGEFITFTRKGMGITLNYKDYVFEANDIKKIKVLGGTILVYKQDFVFILDETLEVIDMVKKNIFFGSLYGEPVNIELYKDCVKIIKNGSLYTRFELTALDKFLGYSKNYLYVLCKDDKNVYNLNRFRVLPWWRET